MFLWENRQGPTVFFIRDRYIKDSLGCAYNTAATVLNGLLDLKLFSKQKTGNEWIYSIADLKSWQ
ncbi:Filamentation induced by cAMP protein fic [Pseudomonas coronafaciens pv. garcae]|uniref:Filamentation induced by cAMP protein fic n=1 Tax=Pseudomonas coronafaciens pv. garcae TaxID=251653 RepID=A0AB37QPQ9_9PSED|nr:Filamentation induced by cAMP protein fic [Pseudomonas coronafaciens pv. oryzae]RMS00759.1 Filamentation induced by cAMP protein fic [Pseudomonas coronafaciens pv. garcae]RMS04824.1 Filamentation induced by cAMP protein fic [Pseudomonas coronafaciens pv. garcae]RMT04222.1 Filamentation induced by cAMP protein fic [Pseudomonas coronafaciens pv. oryzae]RMV08035.1 Filamentation induced by cAMP protein fic [Pseudomonas coronafaciens pv. coronafaciens]